MSFKISLIKSILLTVLLILSHYLITNYVSSNLLKILYTTLVYLFLTYIANKFQFSWRKDSPINNMNSLLSLCGVIGIILLNFSIPTMVNVLLKNHIEIDSFNLSNVVPSVLIAKLLVFPFLEELFFRKTILQGLTNEVGAKKGILISAFLFSLAHIFSGTGLLIAFLGGLFLGYVFNKTQNIYHVTILHIFINSAILFIAPNMLEFVSKLSYSNSILSLISLIVIGLLLILTIKKMTSIQHK